MDQTLKPLIQLRPTDWLRFVFADTEVEYLGTASTDVATEPLRILDTLLRIRLEGHECLVDIEFEAYTSPDIGRRLHEYAARAEIVHKLPVIPVVFWLMRDGQALTSPYRASVGSVRLYDRYFFGVEVYQLPAPEVLALGEQGIVGLLPLIPFTQGGKTLEAAEAAGRAIQAHAPPEELTALATLLGVFAARMVGPEAALELIRRLLMSNDILLEVSPLYRQWVEEWKAEGLAEGLKEGREEGREEGMREGLRDAMLLFWRGRFGEPTAEVSQAISAASRETLSEALLHANSDTPEQLRARFGLS